VGFVDRIHPSIAAVTGSIPGTSGVVVVGQNTDIDIVSGNETVWSTGGLYAFPLTAVSLVAVSTSAADTIAAGTGAQAIFVEGLNAAAQATSQTVLMNGTTEVALSGTWQRVNKAFVITAGSGGTNAGVISIKVSAGATYGTIPTGLGQSWDGVYSVPDGLSACIVGAWAVGSAGTNVASIWTKNTLLPGWRQRVAWGFTTTPGYYTPQVPIVLPELTDIYLAASVSADNTTVRGAIEIIQFAQTEKLVGDV
jgi:hypothetical protein